MAKTVETNGVTLHVEDEGTGAPLVFLHGWSMSGRFFREQLRHFPASHRVLVPDLRGHGQSEKPIAGHTVVNYATDVRGVLVDLDVEKPVLIGWSMGAMVALEYLGRFGGESVAGIVIVDQPPSDFAWDGYEFGAFTLRSLDETNQAIQLDQRSVAEEFAELMFHAPDEDMRAFVVEEILRVPPVVASTILVDQTLRDYRESLVGVDVPALVLFGEDPKLMNPDAGRYLAERIPGARLHTFAHSSHCPFLEEPELFNRTLEEFIATLT